MKFAGCLQATVCLAIGWAVAATAASATAQSFVPKDRSKTGANAGSGANPGTGAARPAGAAIGPAPAGTTGSPSGASKNSANGGPSGAATSTKGTPAKDGGGAASTAANPNLNMNGKPGATGATKPVRPLGPGGTADNSAPRTPEWIPLPADHEKYLDEVLRYWQDSSGKVKRYRCSFRRWEYDGIFVARDPKTGRLPPKSDSTGVIRYAAPDKGMFKVERTLHYTPSKKEGQPPQYLPHPDEPTEHWVCDSKSVFSFDNQKKQLIQTILPPQLQGRAIVDGPLPFMFGAEVDKIKDRFWLRIITPKESQGEYWLEAVPKTRQDSANFKMVHVIIDETDFLPKAMSIFNLNHDPVRSPSCMTFAFEKRETNWSEVLEKLKPFHQEFWEPSTPLGYKKVVEHADQAVADERAKAPPTSSSSGKTSLEPLPLQAQRPNNKK